MARICARRIGWKLSRAIRESARRKRRAICARCVRRRGRRRSRATRRLRTTSVRIALAEANRRIRAAVRAYFHRVRHGQKRRRNSGRFCGSGCRMMTGPNSARRRSSSGRSRKFACGKWLRAMSGISTHVLDTARGKPAADVPVRLERRRDAGHWRLVGVGAHRSGRPVRRNCCRRTRACGGKLPFELSTRRVISRRRKSRDCIRWCRSHFAVRDGEAHFHIPLLLSPNGYTTYRGS